MEFWLIAFGMVAIVAVSMVAALLRGRPVGQTDAAPMAPDMQVYRDQLSEIDRDLARGVLNPDEAERTRIEVSRRALEADRAAARTAATGRAARPVVLGVSAAVLAVLIVGTGGLYAYLGAPGYSDLPLQARKDAAAELRRTRVSQAAAEARLPAPVEQVSPDADVAALINQLRQVVSERPDDQRGLRLLAGYEARMGNFKAAYTAMGKLILAQGEQVPATDFLALAEMMVLAANGYVSPEAETALNEVLARDPQSGGARYYIGLLHAQNDRPDIAYRLWRILLKESTPEAPWYPVLMAELPALADAAGVRFAPPAAQPGPDADDIAAAADMAPADRQAMIRGMVDGLADELSTQGGTADKWARLIRSLGVLGETDRARAIYAEAQGIFAGRDADLAALAAAAQSAGVAP